MDRGICPSTYHAARETALLKVRPDIEGSTHASNGRALDQPSLPLVIATMLRAEGITGVQSYVERLRRYLDDHNMPAPLITPFSWGGPLVVPVFGFRLALQRFSGSAGVVWYRYWHEVFLRLALRRSLVDIGDCIIYAQGPLDARAALRARQGPHQRVVMVVHFRISQADEWADKKQITRDGSVFRSFRQVDRDVIPMVDGLVYMSEWARSALLSWLPEAERVPSEVIGGSLVDPVIIKPDQELLGDLVTIGNLDYVKNHRFMLEVLAAAKRAGRSLTLDIFGEGPLRKELMQLTSSLGLEEQVRFRGFRRDVREFLPRYRVYVHACYSESFCLAIVEAMAAGLPIVAADIGPISELVDDGVEARFWPLDDPAQAATTLIDLLDNESARLKAARAASERFRREFDADFVVPRILSFLRELPAANR